MLPLSPVEQKLNAINKHKAKREELYEQTMRANMMLLANWTLHMDNLINEWLCTEATELYVNADLPSSTLDFEIPQYRRRMFREWIDDYFTNHEYYVVQYYDEDCLNFVVKFNPKHNI